MSNSLRPDDKPVVVAVAARRPVKQDHLDQLADFVKRQTLIAWAVELLREDCNVHERLQCPTCQEGSIRTTGVNVYKDGKTEFLPLEDALVRVHTATSISRNHGRLALGFMDDTTEVWEYRYFREKLKWSADGALLPADLIEYEESKREKP